MDYYSVTELEKTGLVVTAMTSEGHGCWLSNNPNGHAGYREVAAHFGISAERDMVGTFQRHSNTVKAVTRAKHAGQNVMWRESEPIPWDGIVTNERGFMLTSMESDCTPVFLLDPVKQAIGMVHSGWKGTARQISANAVRKMQEEYGTDPADVLAAFGPCICRDCYEVGADLIPPFSEQYSPAELELMFRPKTDGKYFLDVNLAIRLSLERTGVKSENIFDTCRCTYHERVFYSHRRQIKDGLGGRDNMFTGIMLK